MFTSQKRLPVLLLSCCLLVSLLGCGGSRHDVNEKYFLVAANTKLPYWQAAAAGFIQAANQLRVKAQMVGPDTYDAQAEQREFRRLLSLEVKPAGILISPADPELMKGDIDAAISAGIPVLAIDSDSPASQRLTFIGTNNYQVGMMAARVAAKQLHGKGNLVVFTMPGQANLAERLHGYRDVFAEYAQIKIVDVIDIKGDPTIAFDATKEIVEKRRDKVDGFICLEASAGSEVAEVLDRNKVTGKVVMAMDTNEETLAGIRKGLIAATIAQKPFTMAFFGTEVLDTLYHNKLPSADLKATQGAFSRIPAFIDTGATLIDKANVDEFVRQSQASKPQ